MRITYILLAFAVIMIATSSASAAGPKSGNNYNQDSLIVTKVLDSIDLEMDKIANRLADDKNFQLDELESLSESLVHISISLLPLALRAVDSNNNDGDRILQMAKRSSLLVDLIDHYYQEIIRQDKLIFH